MFPIEPIQFPIRAGEIGLRVRPEFFERRKFALKQFGVLPFQCGFGEVQAIFRIVAGEIGGALKVFAREFFVADTQRPAGRVLIKQTEIAVRPREGEFLINLSGAFETSFHFLDHVEGAQIAFEIGDATDVHAEIIIGGSGLSVEREAVPTGGDAFTENFFFGRGRFQKIAPGETGAAKLPGSDVVSRFCCKTFASGDELLLKMRDDVRGHGTDDLVRLRAEPCSGTKEQCQC